MRGRAGVRAVIAALVLASCVLGTAAVAQTTPDTTPDPSTEPTTTTTTTPPTPPSSNTTTTTTAPSSTTTTAPPLPSSADGPADSVYTPSAAEVAAVRESFAVLTDDQRALLKRLQSARDDLATARIELLGLTASVDAARVRLADADRAVGFADDVVQQAERRLRVLRSDMAELASAMYEHLGTGVFLEAVNTADQTAVNRVRTYSRAPQDVLDRMVAQARRIRRQLAQARGQARDARKAAADVVDALQSLSDKQREALATAERASTDAEDAVTAALGSTVALLGLVADPHFGADSITAALAVAQAGAGDPTTLVGAFRVPVDGAPLGSPYGIRVDPLTGSVGYHPGIDLEAPSGAAVHAAAAGTVVLAGDCGGYGNCVVIDHGQSLATVSAHLARVLVVVGQPVADDQVVGLVGSTGRSTGPHLHFEVRLHGAPVDPLPTLTG